MGINQSELDWENERLTKTIALANSQLTRARECNEENKLAIIEAKKELRENTSHSISGLWSSDGFEALAELSQYANPVTDKIIDYEEVEKKIAILENVIKAPYFARIDFKFDGEDAFEPIYIGRSSLKKGNAYDMYVYDWRSPIASVFYRFVTGSVFYDAPGGRITGEVNLKRQYEIRNGELEYFFDAEVQIVDEFLRKLLSKSTSAKMKTIVETIQKEQDIVIRDMENDLMMVQGVAGSGKTSIALHRAAYLMYQGLSVKLSAQNIIIISPNSLFEQYISNVLPELGENNVVSVVFEELIADVLHKEKIQSRNQLLEKLITGAKYSSVIKKSIEFKTSHRFLEILNHFLADLPNRWIPFEDVYYEGKCMVSKAALKKKIAGRKDIPLGVKLKQLEDYILERIFAWKNKRIGKEEELSIKRNIQAFTEIDVSDLYTKLFQDKNYFDSLVPAGEADDSIEDIFRFTQENLYDHILHYDDAIVQTYLKIRINGAGEYKDIKQVVIDEAQDYYPLQYEIFRLLFPGAKFTVLGDMNQTLEKQENMSLYEDIGTILNKRKSSLISMDKSFRCTNEILNYSLKFIDHNPEIQSFNREGEMPAAHAAADQITLAEMILQEVGLCKEMGYGSIGLLCKSEKNAVSLFGSLKDHPEMQLITNESTSDLQGAFVIPVYMSKGLEFDAVLVCDADRDNYHTEDDKKLLYIACTRALHRLSLFGIGVLSPLLS